MGSLECSLSLGVLPAETKAEIAEEQAAGHLTWEGLVKPKRFQIPGPSTTLGIGEPFLFALEARLTFHARMTIATSCISMEGWQTTGIMCLPVFVSPLMQASRF